MKHVQRITALLLCLSLLLSLVTIPAVLSADVPDGSFAGMGEYTVHLMADPSTAEPPSEFGTSSANGKVWVDKSVAANQDHFEITLSALAQEYISEDENITASGPAADVVMILDLSASMQNSTLTLDGETVTRTKAMVKAVNEATEIIMKANNQNRIMIYGYQSDSSGNNAVITEFLPLGHYTNTAWSREEIWSGNSGKYYNYRTSGGIQTALDLEKDGTAFSQKNASTSNGTCTQHGILKAVQALITAIGNETRNVECKPYVLLFTDGAPGNANTNWYDTSTTSCIRNGHENNGSAQISALSILSAALMRDRLQAAYQAYNGKDLGVEWFNIGLGVSSNANGTLFLDPANIAADTSSTGSSIRSYLNTYTSGSYSDYASYKTNYVYTENSYLTNTGEALEQAFKALADTVEKETKTINFPLLSVEGAAGDLIFTDVIGKGLTVDGITLYPTATTPIRGTATGNTYTFAGYQMTASLSTDGQGRQVLNWNIPAKEIAIYSFADRQNITDGNYIPAQPLRLCYKASVADPQHYDGSLLYSNTEAKAQFALAKDNPYYHNTDESLKTAPFASQAKAKNTSGTSPNSLSFQTTVGESTAVTAILGNNGILKPAMQLKKEADSDSAAPDADIGYILHIKNVGDVDMHNIMVTDTLPSDLTYKAGSAEELTPAVNGQAITFTVPVVAKGQTFTIHYKATLAADAANRKELTNTASISEIHTIEVYNPVETTATITVRRLYKVNYEWTGDIPQGVTLPTDAGLYPTDAPYTVDKQFTSQTRIENRDAFGNTTERWSFSGWTDPNNGIMGESDVTIRGVWSYEAFQTPTHTVTYVWSGDIPDGKVLPTDSNTYVCNQPYPVDETFTSQTILPTYDAYHNINGRYTFSGWADPNNGVMGNEDVIIPGIWKYETITVPDYGVLYTWSGDIPQGVTLPTNGNRYFPNQSYPVDTTYTDQTVILDYDAYGNLCGNYSFRGWNDPNSGIMGDADVTIGGVWQYTPITVVDYGVIYTWSGDIPQGVTLPTDNNRYVTNQSYSVNTTYTDQTVITDYDRYGNICGHWNFSGWTDPQGGTMGSADVTIPGVWEYTPVTVPDYKVIYVWSGDVPEGQTLPINTDRYVTSQPYEVDSTYTAQTVIPDHDAFGNLCGNYFFRGWNDPNSGIMGNTDVTIAGVWEYEAVAVPDYQVHYVWSGDIPDGETLPTDDGRYVTNQPYTVDTTYTAQTVIPDYDTFGNLCGNYFFWGWNDPNSGIMGDADVTIPGVWEYETVTVPDYKVVYVWSGDIPEGQTLPINTDRYVTNQPYEVDATYTAQTVIPDYDAFGNLCGNYCFRGWNDPNNGIMGNADVTIPGVWEYEAVTVPDYKVVYVWSGDIPDGETLPTDDGRYVTNQPYEVDTTYTAQTVIPDYDAYGNLCGNYSFRGWNDPNSGIMGDADVTIGGVWIYEPLAVTPHRVIYIWSGEVPEGAVLPTDDNTYVTNQPYPVDTTFPDQMTVVKQDDQGNPLGIHTFHGWDDPNEGVMGQENVIIAGVWTYEDIPQPEPNPEPEPEPELPTPIDPAPKPSAPATGEATSLYLLGILWTLSALSLVVLGILKRRSKAAH